MLIGIDVGGTFTDGVLFSGSSVLRSVKQITDETNLQKTLLEVLDELLAHAAKPVRRIVLSTTLVTNALATGQGERTALLLIPGSGLPYSAYRISPDTWILKGSIDFRGREIERPDKKEVDQALAEIDALGIKRVAVAGKFSNRNDLHERMVRDIINNRYPDMQVCISNEISGRLNFPRRAVTCYYTAMTLSEWNRFADEIEKAVKDRAPGSELHILKADGGTMTLEASRKQPCETVFSGPAASTMGAVALTREKANSVVVDIGGTTTDISLLIEGEPLYASRGALIRGHLTHVNSFAIDSIPLGGDSTIWVENQELKIGPMRRDVAACFGGVSPTVTDAFSVLLELGLGDAQASRAGLQEVAGQLGTEIGELCQRIVNNVIQQLTRSIVYMFTQWENEPAYKVWEVINKKSFVLHRVIGIGAAAPAIIPLLARELDVGHFLHRYSPVANAVGAALVRPTLAVEVHVDTQNGVYTVSPGGLRGEVTQRNFQLQDAKELASKYLAEIGKKRGMKGYADQGQFYLEEQFNVIRGWDRAGRLFDVGIQIAPGFIPEYEGVTE